MSENTDSITCLRCGTIVSPDFRFCPNCGNALFGQRPEVDDERSKGDGHFPAAAAERRQLTVMFCDLVGSVPLSLELDPEDLRNVVQQYQKVASDCIDEYEGYIAQYLGDGILAYFGYPVAHEDEAVRAVRAGRGILHGIERLERRLGVQYGIHLAVRIGIHTGIVVVGEIGTGARRENLALGETPNLAARLQSIAPENGLVVSDATFRMVSSYFEGKDLGPQTLRGTRREERAYQITDERLYGSPLDIVGRRDPVFTSGREREIREFDAHWEEVENGGGRVLMLYGEAGIGKSHIIQVYRQRLSERLHRRIECRCAPYLSNTPLHPLTEWLGSVLNFYPEQNPADRLEMIKLVTQRNHLADPEAVPLLASLLNVPLGDAAHDPGFSPSLRRVRIEEVLIDLLLRIGDDRPLLLVIEDIHWADPTTRSFIQHFADRIHDRKVMLLLTSREPTKLTWSSATRVAALTLERLDRTQVKEVIGAVAKGKLIPDKIVNQVVERADGVPLYVQELTKWVLESDQVVEHEDRYKLAEGTVEISIPATLNDSLMARLDRILPVKEVAQICSTLGREFSFELARVVSQMDETKLAVALERLVDAELLLAEGDQPKRRYMFRHALMQEAAYESVLKSRRQKYHERAAEHLIEHTNSRESRPEIIAHHLTRAGRRSHAASYWLIAGQEAYERWANEEAVDYFTRGLALLDGLKPDPAINYDRFFLEVGLGLASIQMRGYTHPSVLAALESARNSSKDLHDQSLSFPAVRGIWSHYTVIGDHRRAEALALQLSDLAEISGIESQRVDADLSRASTAFWRGRVKEAESEFDRIQREHADMIEVPPPALATQHPLVGALSYRAVAQWYLGFPEQAEQTGQQAIACANRVEHPFSSVFAFGFYGLLQTYFGNLEGVKNSAEQTSAISSRYGFPFWIGIGKVLKAWASSDADPDAAIDAMMAALAELRRAGVQIWTSYPTALLAELMVSRGRAVEGFHLLEPLIARARENDEGYFLPEILRINAHCLEASGKSSESKTIRREAIELAKAQGARPVLLRILLDVPDIQTSAGSEYDALLQETCDSFTEGFDLPELVAARQLCSDEHVG